MKLHPRTFIRFYNRLKPIYNEGRVAAIGYIDDNGCKQIIMDLTRERAQGGTEADEITPVDT